MSKLSVERGTSDNSAEQITGPGPLDASPTHEHIQINLPSVHNNYDTTALRTYSNSRCSNEGLTRGAHNFFMKDDDSSVEDCRLWLFER